MTSALGRTLAVAAVAVSVLAAPAAAGAQQSPVEFGPGEPTGLATREAGRGFAVSWSAPATGPAPNGYVVLAEPGCANEHKTERVAADTTSVRFERLEVCDGYTFKVRAVNAAGKGPWAELHWQRTQHQESEDGASRVPVIKRDLLIFNDLGWAYGCVTYDPAGRYSSAKCADAFTLGNGPELAGHSPLKITAVYLITADDLPASTSGKAPILTIRLNGDWPDTTGWLLEIERVIGPATGQALRFSDANVYGSYATWTNLTVEANTDWANQSATFDLFKPS